MKKNADLFTFKLLLFTIGIITVFLIPPLSAPDEERHFLNAYSIGIGDFLLDSKDETGVGGKWYPQYILDFHDKYTGKYTGDLLAKYNFNDLYFDSWLPVTSEGRLEKFKEGKIWGLDNPFAYIVPAIGMRIGKVLLCLMGENLDTAYNLLILGRLSNFMVFYILATIAVSRTPIYKKTMMTVILLPMTIFLSASLSYDALTIPISMLIFAEVFRLIINEQCMVELREIITLFICATVLAAIKIVYFPILALCLFIPKEKFKSKRQYFISILVVILAAIIGYGIPGIVNKINDERLILDNYDFIQNQKAFLLGNPTTFWLAFLNSVHEYKYFYMNSFVGNLGSLDTNYPTPVSASILCVLIVISIYDSIRVGIINWKIKLVDFILIVTSILGTFLYIYITWTPKVLGVGANLISGVRGRYFIPIYLFFAVLFASNLPKKEFKIGQRIIKELGVLFIDYIILVSISVPLILIFRYWI